MGSPCQVVRTHFTLPKVSQLTNHSFDGKALEPFYEPRPFTGPDPTAEIEKSKIYTGGCHCGNVTMALKTKGPISGGHEDIQECNCSICMRVRTLPPISYCRLKSPRTAQSSPTPKSYKSQSQLKTKPLSLRTYLVVAFKNILFVGSVE